MMGNRLAKLVTLAAAIAAMGLAGTVHAADEADMAATTGSASEVAPPDMAIAAIDKFIAEQKVDRNASGWKTRLNKPPKVSFSPGASYYWNLDTNKGNIKVKLFADTAPMHVSSTLYLTRLGFYDDTVFHRVIPGFMAQGGDPTGTGRGNPGYRYAGEFDGGRRHSKAGMLSMANRGPNTDASQFFLTFTKTPHLDGKHTVFGEVVEGMTTVKEIEKRGTRGGKPTQKLVLKKATISVN